jgi:O-acetyl-ADP-ribose deacetylase (regulator of RNase III)
MTKLIELTGDLFTSTTPALGQGVNVKGLMGSGIAPLFKRRWPAMYAEYRALCLSGQLLAGGLHAWHGDITIYNIASQDNIGRSSRLEWLESSLELALVDADFRGYDRIAIPQIGCGIGGLLRADVRPIVEAAAARHLADIEVWTLPGGEPLR